MRVDRRSLLTGGAALATGMALATGVEQASAQVTAQGSAAADPFAAVRLRWASMLTGNGVIDVHQAPYAAIVAGVARNASGWWVTMADPASTDRALWDDPLSKMAEREYNTRVSMDRLRVVALAWATPGNEFSARQDVADKLVDAVAWLERHRYSILIERYGNWWEWEIGIPLALLDILILLRDPLEHRAPGLLGRLAAAIDRFTPHPYVGTAANRVWRSHVTMLHALVVGDERQLVAARAAIPTTFVDVLHGDGFYRDSSFVQHEDLGYTGGYGRDLLVRSALLFYLLDGSRWAFTAEQMTPLRARVIEGFAPLMYDGAIMDMVRGRNATRANLSDIDSGQTISIGTLYLAAVLHDRELKEMAKGWIARQRGISDIVAYDPKLPAYWLTPHMAWIVIEAFKDRSATPKPRLIGTFSYAEMDRMVHRRPRFALAIAMNSSRIRNFEIANGENLKGWYSGWGTTTPYRADRPNYSDDYWPTVDPYRLAGITLDRRPRPVGKVVGQNESAQVGVLVHDDIGLSAMLNSTDGATFGARVSWFAVGDAILCLGSGIRSTVPEQVETIIANEMMPTPPRTLLVDGHAQSLTVGTTSSVDAPRWFHMGLPGGVLLPSGGALRVLSDTRTHAWWEINKQGASPTDPRTRHYLTIWLDHGAHPDGGSYAYVLLPAATVAQTRAAAAHPPLRVIECTPDVHVGQGGSTHEPITAAVFWNAARAADGMAASAPLLVTVHRERGAVTLALADPLRRTKGTITLTLPSLNLAPRVLDPAMSASSQNGGTVVTLRCEDLRGRTVVGTFAS